MPPQVPEVGGFPGFMDRQTMSVTQQQIAEHLGISRIAVSYALRGRDKVSSQTRDRVISTARQLGYRVNTSARSTRLGKFDAIGLLMSSVNFHSYLPSRLWNALYDIASKDGVKLIIAKLSDEQLTDEKVVPNILREWSVDGLIVNYNSAIPQPMMDLVENHHVPSIWLNAAMARDCVRPDDKLAGIDLTRRMLELGHRRIAYCDMSFLASERADFQHYSKRDRMEGYRAAMREAGLESRCVLDDSIEDPANEISYYRHKLLGDARPTAVITYGLNESEGIRVAALQDGLDVPDELSLATFLDSPLLNNGVSITGMVVPYDRITEVAYGYLQDRIADRDQSFAAVELPYTFYAGYTLRPPPSSA